MQIISVGENFMKCQNLFSEKLFLKIRKIFQNSSAELFTQHAKRNASDYVSTECSSICNVTDNVEDFTYDAATQTCLYTCKRGYAGNHCQYDCDYNCLECGRDIIV